MPPCNTRKSWRMKSPSGSSPTATSASKYKTKTKLDTARNLLPDYDVEASPLPSPLHQNKESLKNKEAALCIHNVNRTHKVPPATGPATSVAWVTPAKT